MRDTPTCSLLTYFLFILFVCCHSLFAYHEPLKLQYNRWWCSFQDGDYSEEVLDLREKVDLPNIAQENLSVCGKCCAAALVNFQLMDNGQQAELKSLEEVFNKFGNEVNRDNSFFVIHDYELENNQLFKNVKIAMQVDGTPNWVEAFLKKEKKLVAFVRKRTPLNCIGGECFLYSVQHEAIIYGYKSQRCLHKISGELLFEQKWFFIQDSDYGHYLTLGRHAYYLMSFEEFESTIIAISYFENIRPKLKKD